MTVLDVDHLLHREIRIGTERLNGPAYPNGSRQSTPSRRTSGPHHRNVAALTDLAPRASTRGSITDSGTGSSTAHCVRDHPLGITVQLGLYMGLRPGEVLGLQWIDIDFDQHTLSVRRSLKRENNQLRFGPPKTIGSNRTLKMPEQLASALSDKLWSSTRQTFRRRFVARF